MARFGIEGLMQKGWSVQKMTLSAPHDSFRPRTYSEKDGYPSQNDFALSPKGTD